MNLEYFSPFIVGGKKYTKHQKNKDKSRLNSKKIKYGGKIINAGDDIENDKNLCAFGVNKDNYGTCSREPELIKMIEEHGGKEKAYKKLGCNGEDDEICALKKLNKTNRKDNHPSIKIKGPKNTDELLNNFLIDEHLDNVTKNFKDKKIYHINYQMIDFAGIKNSQGNGWKLKPTELGSIDIVNDVVKSGCKMLCVVLNTDVRNGPGEHWFAIFCDFTSEPFSLEYFNSSGRKPYPEVQEWLLKTKQNLSDNGYKSNILCNDTLHQKSETECGVYSLYYISKRISGTPFSEFSKRIPDEEMYKFRSVLFR